MSCSAQVGLCTFLVVAIAVAEASYIIADIACANLDVGAITAIKRAVLAHPFTGVDLSVTQSRCH